MQGAGQLYQQIGHGYAAARRPDPRIAEQIADALGPDGSVLNVGAGTGSYEPIDRSVIAVEPSRTMLEQRSAPHPSVRSIAEQLPFPDRSFDVAMALFTIHHWTDRDQGVRELGPVSSGWFCRTAE